MKIAFVNDSCERLGVEYLSALLKNNGHTVKVFTDPQLFDDENLTIPFLARVFEQKDTILHALKVFAPDLIGFSVVTDFYQWAIALANRIKTELAVPIIFGGIHPTSVPEKVLRHHSIDMVCVGEGEHALLELVTAMQNGDIDYSIRNIWFKKDGAIIKNEVRPLIANLDLLPFADKEAFYESSPHFSRCYFIMTSRGCIHECSYCCNSLLKKIYAHKGTYVRFRSVRNVIDELKNANKHYTIRMIRIHDDDFLAHDVAWLKEFSVQYAKHIAKPFACFSHPNSVTEAKAHLLREAGCHDIELGVQSISETTRKTILNRHGTNKAIISAIEILKKAGIRVITDNILGIPHQDDKEIIDLMTFYNRYKVMKVYCFGFRHYPATDIIDYSRRNALLTQKEIDDIEEGVNTTTFIQSGDLLNREGKQLQTYFAFFLYLPQKVNEYILRKKLYRAIVPLPYFILVIFSNWLRIPYRFNWALHITISRYSHYMLKKFMARLPGVTRIPTQRIL